MAALSDPSTGGQTAPVGQRLREVLEIEESLGAHLRAGLDAVAGHAAAADVVGRLLEIAGQQHAAVRLLLDEAGSGPHLDSSTGLNDARVRVAVGSVEAALRGASVLCSEAVLGYAALHQTAHVFHTGQLGPVLKLAAQHLRAYTSAVREIDQLMADVVAWELRRDGQRCVCPCAYCSLGVCWCIADTTDTVNAAWREANPSADGLRVARNTRATPGLGLREGDVVVAVNAIPVSTLADVRAAVPSPVPGGHVRLTVRRPDGTTEGLVAARP